MRLRSLWILYYIIAEIDFGRQNKMSKDIPALILLLFVEIDYAPVWQRSDEGLGYRLGWPLLCQQIPFWLFFTLYYFLFVENNYAPVWKRSDERLNLIIKHEDTRVELKCLAEGHPSPKGEWYKDGLPMATDKDQTVRSMQQVNI